MMLKWNMPVVFAVAMFIFASPALTDEAAAPKEEDSAVVSSVELLPERTFNSELPLEVFAAIPDDRKEGMLCYHPQWNTEKIGETPSEEPLDIPESFFWVVKPQAHADEINWDVFVEMIRREDVPGVLITEGAEEHHIARLKELENLRILHLTGRNIPANALVHLREMPNLQWLGLRQTNISGADLVHLKELDNLEGLDLGFTQVTDDGLKYLGDIPHLKFLSLSGTQITDKGLENFKEFSDLRELAFSFTQITRLLQN